MKILDATAGNRGIWINKAYPGATFIDIRPGTHPQNLLVDCRHTSFADGEFDLVVFDPPHMSIGPRAQMAQRYGSFSTGYIRELVAEAFREFRRVLRPDGLVAFKWNDHDTPLQKVLDLATGFEPLVGVRVAQRIHHESETSWVLLRRADRDGQTRLDVPAY
ncbi:MAG TPA: class I SAM-dependent methyltransferase [Thermoplasmata archaeon]|nr:class I SAM-dependent methyltransferase [Thermoplasmata archaeon]